MYLSICRKVCALYKYLSHGLNGLKSLLGLRGVSDLYILTLIFGIIAIAGGLAIKTYRVTPFSTIKKTAVKRARIVVFIDRITSFFPLTYAKSYLKSNLSFCLLDDAMLNLTSGMIILVTFLFSILIVFLLQDVGQLWYTKILIAGMGLLLPFYIAVLLIDLYKHRLTRHIPRMIDEFRSAFIKHGKVKPALKECCMYIDKGLGRIISHTADSVFLEDSLIKLRSSLNNIWFNIFVVLVINFKENGGGLVDQLYRLNRTITRYSSVEKKKAKRLIWYEMFAVASSVLSIPAVLWLNHTIMGESPGLIIDAKSNIIISRIIVFSIISLIAARILRKM